MENHYLIGAWVHAADTYDADLHPKRNLVHIYQGRFLIRMCKSICCRKDNTEVLYATLLLVDLTSRCKSRCWYRETSPVPHISAPLLLNKLTGYRRIRLQNDWSTFPSQGRSNVPYYMRIGGRKFPDWGSYLGRSPIVHKYFVWH